jgi:putative oxidoreductase
MEIITNHEHAAVLLTRLFLGLLFFFQGYDAVIRIGVREVANTYKFDFEQKGIPASLTYLGALFTSYTELIGGFMLIIGLFEYYALYLLGINLIVATVAFSLNTALWDTRHVYPRLLLILFLLLVPASWDTITVDHLLFNK